MRARHCSTATEWIPQVMEKKMETTKVYGGYIGMIFGIMEKKMQTTI